MLPEQALKHISLWEKELLEKLHARAKRELENSSRQCVAHRFDHAERVMMNALILVEDFEDVDYFVLLASCLLHDIDHPKDDKSNHVQLSIKKAQEIIHELEFPEEKIEKILDLISKHSTEDIRDIDTIEAKILFDAISWTGLVQ
jgi:uncharacterized protein